MSFNIPGYFLDQKTKKLFKIQAHGPFSLKELKKRLEREAREEQEAAAAATSSAAGPSTVGSSLNRSSSSQQRSPTTIRQFLRQRSLNNPLINADSTLPFLMTQLKSRSQIQLEGPKHKYNNMLVDLTSDRDYGEMIASYRTGRIARLGYQVNPGFQLWNAGPDWNTEGNADVLSLQFGTRSFMLNGQACRTIVGTSGGHLWRYSAPKLPPILNDEVSNVISTNSNNSSNFIRPQPITSYLGYTESSLDCLFSMKKDLFWSCSLDDENDHLVVGGDQAIHQLTSTFDLVTSRKVNSSIFATHLPQDQPNLCYTGSRNGLIQLFDFRQKKQIHLTPKFKQSSSVTRIQSLPGGFNLLTVGMDGSVDIWDTRQPVRGSSFGKQKQINNNYRGNYSDRGTEGGGWKQHQQPQQQTSTIEPIRKLKGHVNESSHHLGFDIDLENNLLMLAGSDGRVRIWSIFSSSSNEPLWCSEQFESLIPAAKFMVSQHQHPCMQDAIFSSLSALEGREAKQSPGVILFGAAKQDEEKSSIQWLTALK